MKKYLLLLSTVSLLSCSSHYKFWDVSEFNLQPGALEDEEPIKLLYTSQGPDRNGELDYYIQVIAVSQKTGDTVNILTPVNNGFAPGDGDNVYNYISPANKAYALIQMNEQELKNLNNIDCLPEGKPDNINKVARDPDHDNVAHNKFPTVIGAIGTIGNINK